jgi:hypothetical protein
MLNGRRRDHGADRAHLEIFGVGRNGVANCQVNCWPHKPLLAHLTLVLCKCLLLLHCP